MTVPPQARTYPPQTPEQLANHGGYAGWCVRQRVVPGGEVTYIPPPGVFGMADH
jgi:hypothetical protein